MYPPYWWSRYEWLFSWGEDEQDDDEDEEDFRFFLPTAGLFIQSLGLGRGRATGEEEEGDVVLLAVLALEAAVVVEGRPTCTTTALLQPTPDAVGSLGCCWARMRLRLPLPPSMTTRPLMFIGARGGMMRWRGERDSNANSRAYRSK